MKKIIAYTDGGARGNPGPSGIGVFITDAKGEMMKEVKKFLGHGTNNVAEYTAALVALETLHRMFKEQLAEIHVELRMDSQLVERQLNGVYKVKDANLKILFEKIQKLRSAHFPHFLVSHVRREKNKDADRLANEAMDSVKAH